MAVPSPLVQTDVLLERILHVLGERPSRPADVAEALATEPAAVHAAMWGLVEAGAIRATGFHVGPSAAVVPWTAFTFTA